MTPFWDQMVLGRKWVLLQHFVGNPKPEDFKLVEEELGELKDNEIQYKSLFLSVDPYMRPYTMRMKPPIDPMIGSSVAVVEESKNPKYPKGNDDDQVICRLKTFYWNHYGDY